MKLLSKAIQKRFDDYMRLSIGKEQFIPPHCFDSNPSKYSLEDVRLMWHDGIVASSKDRHDALYIHIPFCVSRCSFCMYDSQIVRPKQISPYVSRILKEFDYWKGEIREPLDSLYVGGGTPSILSVNDMKNLFQTLNNLSFVPNSSRTFELSPESATVEKLYKLGETIINRISMGVQSLDETVLKKIKRNNLSRSHIRNLINTAKIVNFDDINIDLMVGLDGQDEMNVRSTIEDIVGMNPLSITLYTFRDVNQTQKKGVGERLEEVNKQLVCAYNVLQEAGWLHVAGNINTEYNIFYSQEKKKNLIRHQTSIDVCNNLNLFGIGSHAIGFNPAIAYECDSFSKVFDEKDKRYIVYKHTPKQQMQLAVCNMLYCDDMFIDTSYFFDVFGRKFEDVFSEELEDLNAINRVLIMPSGFKFISNSKYESAAIQKFFWDNNFLQQYPE